MLKEIQFKLNGEEVAITCSQSITLSDILRENFNHSGAKECYGKSEYDSCTVLLDGEAVDSCLVLVDQVTNAEITTVEGVRTMSQMDILQQTFTNEGTIQCGYCTSGLILMAKEYLNRIDKVPSTDEVMTALGGDLCRCTEYTKIIEAVKVASLKNLESNKELKIN